MLIKFKQQVILYDFIENKILLNPYKMSSSSTYIPRYMDTLASTYDLCASTMRRMYT